MGNLGQSILLRKPAGEGHGAIDAELRRKSFEGIAVDLDDVGRLVVDTGSGRRVVDAGDVIHIRPTTG